MLASDTRLIMKLLRKLTGLSNQEINRKRHENSLFAYLLRIFPRWATFDVILQELEFSSRTVSKLLQKFIHDKLIERRSDVHLSEEDSNVILPKEHLASGYKHVIYRLDFDSFIDPEFNVDRPETLILKEFQGEQLRESLRYLAVLMKAVRDRPENEETTTKLVREGREKYSQLAKFLEKEIKRAMEYEKRLKK